MRNAIQGKVFCVPMLEWHVHCASPGCDNLALVVSATEADTAKEANRLAKINYEGNLENWKEISGLWYCPIHTPWR